RLAVARNRQQRRLPREIAQLDEEGCRNEAQVELLECRLAEGEELAAQAVAAAARVLKHDTEALHGRQMAVDARLELPDLGCEGREPHRPVRVGQLIE